MIKLDSKENVPLRILFVGAQNTGSHSGGLLSALNQSNQVIQSVNPREFIPTIKDSAWLRLTRKMLMRMYEREFNIQILQEIKTFQPEVLIAYKGESIWPSTLEAAHHANVYCINIFPDVSFFTHGPWLPKTLPLYHHLFTTKSFGPEDLYRHLGLTNVTVLPHGFDPEVHRPLPAGAILAPELKSDVSFIGTWSPKKEAIIDTILRECPNIDLKIWGSQWESAQSLAVRSHAMGRDIMGNMYPFAIQGSTINLAILSEARTGSSAGDQTTSRTFDIPASGGFMIHERTDELLTHFADGVDVACFSDGDDLAELVRYYLADDEARERIRIAGHKRCLAEHSINHRASLVLKHCYEQLSKV